MLTYESKDSSMDITLLIKTGKELAKIFQSMSNHHVGHAGAIQGFWEI